MHGASAARIVFDVLIPGAMPMIFTGLRLSLRDGYPAQLQTLLEKDEVDLVVTLIEKKLPLGIHSLALLEMLCTVEVISSAPVATLLRLVVTCCVAVATVLA